MIRFDCEACVIRSWRDSDRESLLRFANNRKVWRNLRDRFPHPYTEADADAWFAFCRDHPEHAGWAIEVEQQAVGGISVRPGQDVYVKTGGIGYWLGEPWWGRGIMTRAVRAVSDHAFNRLGLERIEAPVFEWNPASMRVLEKCGYQPESTRRRSIFKDGQLIDCVLYVRLAGSG